MTNFNTVNELKDKSTATYIAMALNFLNEAEKLTAAEPELFIMKMAAREVKECYTKARTANCEFTAYANAHAAEVWLGKMTTGQF